MLTTLITLNLLTGAAAWPPGEAAAWGTETAAGDGFVRSFLTENKIGEPERFGVELALDFDSLPSEPPAHGSDYEFLVPLPDDATGLLPFDHVTVSWNPRGHIPMGNYDVPHVDFHFYMLTQIERAEIEEGDCAALPLTCNALARAVAPLEPSAQPRFYSNIAAVVPRMGNHLVDLRSDEFGRKGFSKTLVWGTWDGEIVFLEPMVTRACFEATVGEDCRAIETPETFADAGWYPTEYCVRADDNRYAVILEEFEWFEATQ